MRLLSAFVAMGVAGALAAPAALAHIQVTPTTAAPGDAVLFEVLVPGEKEARTTEVALQIPRGVLPFSWDDPPGWDRKLEMADDGSIAVARWRGRLAPDGFARFTFLASTPEQEGEISWKAVQRYDDGSESAWIEPPEGDFPAAVTEVSASAERQNAGGETGETAGGGAGGGDEPQATEEEATPAPAEEPAPAAAEDDDGGGNTLAIVLGAVGAVLGAAALTVALGARRVSAKRG
jgi:uncharacterized protein YcnI